MRKKLGANTNRRIFFVLGNKNSHSREGKVNAGRHCQNLGVRSCFPSSKNSRQNSRRNDGNADNFINNLRDRKLTVPKKRRVEIAGPSVRIFVPGNCLLAHLSFIQRTRK